jgi:hypothetical protein
MLTEKDRPHLLRQNIVTLTDRYLPAVSSISEGETNYLYRVISGLFRRGANVCEIVSEAGDQHVYFSRTSSISALNSGETLGRNVHQAVTAALDEFKYAVHALF